MISKNALAILHLPVAQTHSVLVKDKSTHGKLEVNMKADNLKGEGRSSPHLPEAI